MKRNIEIRAAEGGDDAKLFVEDLLKAYIKMAARLGWGHSVLEKRPSSLGLHLASLELTGCDTRVENEAGGMRMQRVPPTERSGRVHTSTVTVAVIDPQAAPAVDIPGHDLKVQWYSGSGAGGQNRNKVQNSCRLIHLPTGTIKTAQFRDRKSSYAHAYAALLAELTARQQAQHSSSQNAGRKAQVGSGMRGDKVRTFRFQDDQVVDHRTNKSASCRSVMKGNFDLLW